ncbi:hypothetical protein HYC85_011260 [Camellia sinensis]|uniref:RING-type E3 ubiquitin transferase n=1 Tax=Camellia sinensis TaxID=4442 RepID=A0A7J7H9S3_CAMSI|nr:hypothetical protein HYC85_011260 [Camellia sinensis]
MQVFGAKPDTKRSNLGILRQGARAETSGNSKRTQTWIITECPNGDVQVLRTVKNGVSTLMMDFIMMNPSSLYASSRNFSYEYGDMRLDIDDMSYEVELLALGERIGNVNTGLSEDMISKCLTETKIYSDRNHEERTCCICLNYDPVDIESIVKIERIVEDEEEPHLLDFDELEQMLGLEDDGDDVVLEVRDDIDLRSFGDVNMNDRSNALSGEVGMDNNENEDYDAWLMEGFQWD